MKNRILHHVIFWSAVAGLLALFALCKYGGPRLVEALYQDGRIGLLYQLTGGQKGLPLDYYTGKLEDYVYGPLSILFSGLAFLLLCLKFLPRMTHSRYFFLAVFTYLLATRFEVLLFPPYGDAVGGPFVEAVWLLRHGFDYKALAAQPDYIHGGPRVYLYSIYPTCLAMMMKWFPSVKRFLIVNHLLVFAAGSAILTLFFKILKRVFEPRLALLGAALLLAQPLFQSQVEAINMEIPTLFFAMGSVFFLVRKQLWPAALLAAAASMVKGYAVMICGAVFFTGILLFACDRRLHLKGTVLIPGFLAMGFAVLIYKLSFRAFSEGGAVDMVGAFQGWASIRTFPVTYLVGASVLIFIGYYFWGFRRSRPEGERGIAEYLRLYHVPVVMGMTAVGWFVLFLNSYSVSPRYTVLLGPFSVFTVMFAGSLLIRQERVRERVMIAAIVFSLGCSYGLLYTPELGNNHVLLERSLEYRNDLKLYQKVADRINTKYYPLSFGAQFIMAQALAIPEMGYVTKDLNVTIYGMRCNYLGIKNFQGLDYSRLDKFIWIGLKSDMPAYVEEDYPVSPYDKIIEEIYAGDRKATLFLGGVAIQKMQMRLIYLSRTGQM